MLSILSRKTIAILATGVLGVGILGGAAMAAVPPTDIQVRAEEAERGDHRRFKLAWNATRAAIDYIGLPSEAVRAQLAAGKTLGEIADQQPGKSREGLIRFLHEKAQEAVAKAVAEGKLTAEQGRELMERLDAGIVKLVDKTWDDRPHTRRDKPSAQRTGSN